jgi:hypothetical protein
MTYQAKYAIAVEDKGQLFLFLEITRSHHGDVCFNFNEHHANRKPHSSYHASGQRHHKSHNHMVLPKKNLQRPNDKFKDSVNIITTSIRGGDGRAWGVICKPAFYNEIMTMKDEMITPKFGLQLSVDLYESGSLPSGYNNCIVNVIQKQIFNDDVPQIVATLYEIERITHQNNN